MTAMAVAVTLLLAIAGDRAAARTTGHGRHPAGLAGAGASEPGGGATSRAQERAQERSQERSTEIPAANAAPAAPASDLPFVAVPDPVQPGDAVGVPPGPSSTGTEPPTATEAAPEISPVARRPRFAVAVAMGASIDASSSPVGKVFGSPAFAGAVEFGDGPLGFQLRLLSSQASGRSADAPPDRLAVDLMLAVRPWAARMRGDGRWGPRVLRAVTLDVGLAGERISAGPVHANRAGLVVGVHTDLPLTGVAGEPGELRVRLTSRRMLAEEAMLGSAKSGDSTEVLGGLVAVF